MPNCHTWLQLTLLENECAIAHASLGCIEHTCVFLSWQSQYSQKIQSHLVYTHQTLNSGCRCADLLQLNTDPTRYANTLHRQTSLHLQPPGAYETNLLSRGWKPQCLFWTQSLTVLSCLQWVVPGITDLFSKPTSEVDIRSRKFQLQELSW